MGSGIGSRGRSSAEVDRVGASPPCVSVGGDVSNSGGLVRGVACTLVMSFAREQ